MPPSGLAANTPELLEPRQVLTSALDASIREIFAHYGVLSLKAFEAPAGVPAEASIGARIQFANRQLSVGLTLLATPQILDATHPAPPEIGITSADLRDWALELCNQLSGALRARLVRYGIHARPSLPESAHHYDRRQQTRVHEALHAFGSEYGELYVQLASWVDSTLMVSEIPERRTSMAPGDLRLF